MRQLPAFRWQEALSSVRRSRRLTPTDRAGPIRPLSHNNRVAVAPDRAARRTDKRLLGLGATCSLGAEVPRKCVDASGRAASRRSQPRDRRSDFNRGQARLPRELAHTHSRTGTSEAAPSARRSASLELGTREISDLAVVTVFLALDCRLEDGLERDQAC